MGVDFTYEVILGKSIRTTSGKFRSSIENISNREDVEHVNNEG
jgi:hypothetical protein